MQKITLRILAIICWLLMQQYSFAQYTGTGSWNILNFKYTHTPKLSFFTEAQLRSLSFYNQFHYYEIKGGFNYKVLPNLKLSLGAGTYQTYREGGNFLTPKNNDEFRIWPQLILLQDVLHLKVEQRFRAEMRWTSDGFRNRYRYRLAVSHPFGKGPGGTKPFLFSISDELFFTNREPYFERNRLQFNINYRYSPSTTFQMGYLRQFDYLINDEIGRDFFLVGLYFEFSKIKLNRNKTDTELKDY